MPPRVYSRHIFSTGFSDEDGNRYLTLPDAFRFQALADNRRHVVQQGDTLQHLAARYFEGFPRAAGLWWVIAEFQPDPIVDPTLLLEPGTVLFIPSLRTVFDTAFSEDRRDIDTVL